MGEACLMNHGSGGGGGSFNFSIKSYPSEAAKPDFPRHENDIAVITEIRYKNYIFSPIEPYEVQEGLLWFVTTLGGEFEFSITKKNPILIGLQKCKQYIQGKWQNVVGYIGLNGRWLQFSNTMEPYFYQSDVEDYDNHEFTGGYTGRVSNGNSMISVNANSTHLLVKTYSNSTDYGEDYGWAYTNNAIDVSNYSRVVFKVKRVSLSSNYNGAKGYCQVGISSRPNGSFISYKNAESGGTYAFDIGSNRMISPLIKCYVKNDKKQNSEIEISSIILE